MTATRNLTGRASLLRRAWERIQYPAGPESRERFEASRHTGYGW